MFKIVFNIYSNSKSREARMLSNFAPNSFVFDNVQISCMEGFLQSLKIPDPDVQRQVCLLTGKEAKRFGMTQGKWKNTGVLYWRGRTYNRFKPEYQELLDCAFSALAENQQFASCLLDTGHAVLVHSIGKKLKQNTVLTEQEFVKNLYRQRRRLRKNKAKFEN